MHRRDLLRGAGAAAALTLLPGDVRAAWARVAAGVQPRALSARQVALVGTLCGVIIPRTDTPGAVDVHVPEFIDALVAGSWLDADRARFRSGLDGLGTHLGNATGLRLTTLLDELEARADRRAEPARTYWQLKALIVHGYFTSEPVMTDVLRTEVMPGRFDGAAPLPLRRAPGRTGGGGHA